MVPNVICTCTLRCDRLFLSADCFEVKPVRSIQSDTIFWWVSKLKLKPSSHLHNILPPKNAQTVNMRRKWWGRGIEGKALLKKKKRVLLHWLNRSLAFYSTGSICLTHHAFTFSLHLTQRQTLQFHSFSFIFLPHILTQMETDAENSKTQHLLIFLLSHADLTTCSHTEREGKGGV